MTGHSSAHMLWRTPDRLFDFPGPTLLMGIINVTPDSFSDGGRYLDPGAAEEHALRLVREGADILDIGGESTRPAACCVDQSEELRRVLPVLKRICGKVSVSVSIDTRKPRVARAALDAGVAIVNDVEANRDNDEMWRIVAAARAGYVCVHMQGTPRTMQVQPHYDNVVRDVSGFFADRLRRLEAVGVEPDRVVLDPGIGFGKTLDHNLLLLAHLDSLRRVGRPRLVGLSRKSFIGKLLGAEVEERLPASLACSAWAVSRGACILRTHDVAATRQAVRIVEALMLKQEK